MPTLKPVSDPNIIAQLNGMGGGKPMTQSQRADDLTTLRKEFNQRQSVQDYASVMPILGTVMSLPDTPEGDLNLIYAFGKAMDPGSVVREGEMTMVNNSGTIADNISGALRKELEGSGRFPPQRRKQLVNEIRRRAGAYNQAYLAERRRYAAQAAKSGFDPADVIGEHAGKPYRWQEEKFLGRPVRDTDMQGRPLKPKGGGWSIERAD